MKKAKLSKQEDVMLKKALWPSYGWALLFSLAAFLPMFLFGQYVVNITGVDVSTAESREVVISVFSLFLWPIYNAVVGWGLAHFVLKGQVKKKNIILDKGYSFKQLRKAAFIRWYWQTLLVQIGFWAIAIVLEMMFDFILGGGASIGFTLSMYALMMLVVIRHFYQKGFFTLSGVTASTAPN